MVPLDTPLEVPLDTPLEVPLDTPLDIPPPPSGPGPAFEPRKTLGLQPPARAAKARKAMIEPLRR
jgi:hypothetical protein